MPLDSNDFVDEITPEQEEELYARRKEIETFADLEKQHGTPIPAFFSMFYTFIQNPSTVSVETFKRMVDSDDTVGSGVDFLTTCLAARLGAYQHPSPEVTEFVNKALDNIEGGWVDTIKEILSASWVGFSVAEKVWQNTDQGYTIKKIMALPPSTILFSVKRTGELESDGILQYQRNFNPSLLGASSGSMFGFLSSLALPTGGPRRNDPYARFGDLPFPVRVGTTFSYLAVRIPTQKVIHYAFNAQGKFSNPYGRSLLRRAYKYYVMKDAILQMMATALDRKGTPLNVWFADPNHTVIDQQKVSFQQEGSVSVRERDNIGMRGDQALHTAVKNIHNDTNIILPGKKGQHYDIHTVPTSANTADFVSALDFCNKSIMRALLLPSLVFTSGDGSGSFALGQEHAKTFDKILDSINAGLVNTLLQQVIKELIHYNFGEEVYKKDGLGTFGKRELTADEREKEMNCFATAIDKGIIDAYDLSDLNKMREAIGFEPKDKAPEKPDPFTEGGEDDDTSEGGDTSDGSDKAGGSGGADSKDSSGGSD